MLRLLLPIDHRAHFVSPPLLVINIVSCRYYHYYLVLLDLPGWHTTLPHTVGTSRSIAFYATFLPFSSPPLITWSTCHRPHPAVRQQKQRHHARTTHRERQSFHSGPSLPASSRPKLHQFQPVPVASPARHPPPPTAINCLPRFNATPSLFVRPSLEPPFSPIPTDRSLPPQAWNTPRPGVETNDFTLQPPDQQTISSLVTSSSIITPPAHILLPVECHLALVLEPDPVPSTPQNPHIVDIPRHRRQSGGKRALLHLAQALHPGPDDPLLLVA